MPKHRRSPPAIVHRNPFAKVGQAGRYPGSRRSGARETYPRALKTASPSRGTGPQWQLMRPFGAYRCGGSTGCLGPRASIPVSRLTRATSRWRMHRLSAGRVTGTGRSCPSQPRSVTTCTCDCYCLTQRKIFFYSVCMEAEFDSLESKVSQFTQVCERLRAENVELRAQLSLAQNDAKRLAEKIDGARARLESLLVRLPE